MEWEVSESINGKDGFKPFGSGKDETFITSYTTSENIDFSIQGVGICLLTIFGISANVLSVIVLSRPKLKSSLTTLLLGLTISDICFIVTRFLYLSLEAVLKRLDVFPYYSSHIQPQIFPWIYPICFTAQMSSIYFIAIITLERYFAVCHGPNNTSIFTSSTATIRWSVFVVLFSISYNIPRFFEFEVMPMTNEANEVKLYEIIPSEWRYEGYDLYYGHWGYLTMIVFIPFTVLVAFSIAIFTAVIMRNSTTNARTTTEDIQLATMLLGIVITHLFCNLLSLLYLLRSTTTSGTEDEVLFDHEASTRNFLVTFSHSSNFLFYYTFGARFRRQLRKILGFYQRRGRNVNSESSSVSADGNSCTLLEQINSGHDDDLNCVAKRMDVDEMTV